MSHSSSSLHRRPPSAARRSGRSRFPSPVAWQGPTLREFVHRVESEFGPSGPQRGGDHDAELTGQPARGASDLTGLTASERLSPDALRELCHSLGLPPEDFGVEPD